MSEGDLPKRRAAPLAIVGMSCMFPRSRDLGGYWATVTRGRDAIEPVPASHWRPDDLFDADPKRPDFTYARSGGFIEAFDFDPLAYGFPPKTLEATDTSQILGLVNAQRALEDAGYPADGGWDRSQVSVVLGVTGALELVIPLGARLGHPLWRKALDECGVDPQVRDEVMARISEGYVDWQEASFPGLLGNVVAGRIANRLDLGGTNCVVDAACASSLSALHLAALELESGRADMVLSGGVDTFNDIFMYMCFSKTPALSPTGHSRPFDAEGDGTILGEGIGVVVLKRLADAERDGDRIYAIVKGLGSSSDGKGQAIYAPSSRGQARALKAAYEISGVSPETVELIEAHGTGTKVGDAVELEGLLSVYPAAEKGAWCALGSVKSQIGHTKAAAGVASLIKASLALYHKVLPPTIKLRAPLPQLRKSASPFYVNTECRPWMPQAKHPRRAGLSALGFGGSNFHCVLEEHQPKKTAPTWSDETLLFAFGGPDKASIEKALAALPKAAGQDELRARAASSRRAFKVSDAVRFLWPCSPAEFSSELPKAQAFLKQARGFALSPQGLAYGEGPAKGELAVLFPGQGAQYLGMMRDWVCSFPEAFSVLCEAEAATAKPLAARIYPQRSFETGAAELQEAELRDTAVAQPSIGAVSLGAWRVLQSLGLGQPKTFMGHSYGELTALCAAGRLSSQDFYELSAERGRLMAAGAGDRGGMIAVKASEEALRKIVAEEGWELVLANINAPDQVVLSGPTAEVAKASKRLAERGLKGAVLPVSAAFHSPLVAGAARPFAEKVGAVSMPAGVSVLANSTAEPYPESEEAAQELLGHQLARPVQFRQSLERLYANGHRVFLEVGPGARLTGLVKASLESDDVLAIALDAGQGKRPACMDLARALAALSAWGLELELARFDPCPDWLQPKARLLVPISGANVRPKRAPRPALAKVAEQRSAPVNRLSAELSGGVILAAPASNNGHKSSNGQHAYGSNGHGATSRPKPEIALAKQAEQKIVPPSRPSPGRDAESSVSQEPDRPALPQGDALSEALRVTQENITALQRLHEQTARLHERFMEGQEQAQQTFHMLFEQQRRLLEGSPISAWEPAPARHAPARPAAPTPAPIVKAHAPVARPSSPAPAPAPAPAVRAAPAPQLAPAKAESKANSSAASQVLLEVVAEKTGYPAEMLELDMGLDTDLGIDSIKRVEILSALQEKLPGLPHLKSEQMGQLQTLRDIVQALGGLSAGTPAAAAPVAAAAPKAQAAGPASQVLLEVVAEKTGYPAEMLELDMGLDTDLGIDSIKRVEILSALQEKLPGLPQLKSEQMGQLQTLRDIVQALGAVTETPAGAASEASAPQATSEEGIESEGVSAVLLSVVAEKTGYPAEMLELDMGLDTDLGIDSIKRVEILSALQEKIPGLPHLKSEQMGQLQTLRDIVGVLAVPVGAGTGGPPGNPKMAEAGPSPRTVAPLERLLVSAREISGERPPLSIRDDAPLFITDDDLGLSAALAEALEDRGIEARVVSLAAAQQNLGAVAGLILVSPSKPDTDFCRDALLACRAQATSLRRGGTLFATISRLDGAFGLRAIPEGSWLGGALAGLSKTASWEWPELSCKALDLALDAGLDSAEALADELLLRGPIEVGLGSGSERLMLQLESHPLTALPENLFGPEDCILVTGGARGVTAASLKSLLRCSRPGVKLVLLGRSAAPGPLVEPFKAIAGLLSGSDDIALKRALVSADPSLRSPKAPRRDGRAAARRA
jgi:acyl transferase domain-containing protein